MRRERKSRGLGYFLAELLILVVGISASFALNEWRIERQESRQEVELLESFKANLAIDSLTLFSGSKQLKSQVENAQKVLLSDGNTPLDSIFIPVISLLNYVPFNSNDITYQQMRGTGTVSLIKNDSLAARIIGLYENDFEILTTWTQIDAEHVRGRLIPHVEENFPFTVGLQYSQASRAIQREFISQVQQDEFKHLVQFGLSYKSSTRAYFEAVLKDIRETIELINQELSTSQKASDQESISPDQ